MILLPELNLVIITPGKTASTALRAELKEPKYGAILLHGPQGGGTDYNKHTPHVPLALPEPMRDPTIAVTVRNPFDRAASLWKHFCRYGNRTISFADFVETVLTRPTSWWFFRYTMIETLEGTKFDHVLRVEDLPRDLEAIGLRIKHLPVRHADERSQGYRSFYSPSVRDQVRQWAAEDFRQFGYDADELNDLEGNAAPPTLPGA